jgi:hypothetical protein
MYSSIFNRVGGGVKMQIWTNFIFININIITPYANNLDMPAVINEHNNTFNWHWPKLES